MKQTIFYNARMILPDSVLEHHYLTVADGKIQSILPEPLPPSLHEDALLIDCGGDYLSPGFIDTHCHGGGGADFMDGSADDILTACRAHLKHGTTAITPTTLTCSDEELFRFFDCYEEALRVSEHMPHLLGIHLEGPYFSEAQAGAQPVEYLVLPERSHYMSILDRAGDMIVNWSVAPELPGAMDLGDELSSRGITASMGHSDALMEIAEEAVQHGYTELTHFYSGMSSIIRVNGHRKLGLVEAGYLFDDLTVEIIADGVHLPPELLKLILKCKDHDHICLVTDSMRGADMPDGPSLLGSVSHGKPVIIRDGVANMPSFECFAGSVATTDRLVRVMVQKARLPVWEAVKMITVNPAVLLGISDRYGSITPGRNADLLLFDDDIQIHSVYVSGVEQIF